MLGSPSPLPQSRYDSLPDYLVRASKNLKYEKARTESLLQGALPRAEWPDVAEWIQKRFYLYDNFQLLTLHERQSRPLKEAMRLTPRGTYEYTTILWSWMKKSAKSTIIAAVADYVAWHKPNAMIRLVANDLNQADSRVGFYMRENIKLGALKGYTDDLFERDQELRKDTKVSISGYRIDYPNGSKVEMVPVDPAGEAGGNDDMIVFSELWGWKSKAHQQMWSEMTISSNKFGYAQKWIDTYAGFKNDSPVLERLYDQVVTKGEAIWPGWEVYTKGSGFATWTTVPHLPWQTKEYYEQEERDLAPSEFNRMHRNQWVDSEDAFVPASWWKACGHLAYEKFANGTYPPLTHHDQIILGIDAGYKSDCFTIVGVSFDRYNREEGDPPGVIVRYVKAWYPEEYDQFDFEEPFQELKRLCEEYDVLQIAYDPYQLYKFATDFNKLGLSWMVEFQQGAERAVGDKLLYDLIRARRLLHFEDPELDQHIKNAHKKADGRGLRLIKGESEKNKIDLAVALAMASKRCIELSEPED